MIGECRVRVADSGEVQAAHNLAVHAERDDDDVLGSTVLLGPGQPCDRLIERTRATQARLADVVRAHGVAAADNPARQPFLEEAPAGTLRGVRDFVVRGDGLGARQNRLDARGL